MKVVANAEKVNLSTRLKCPSDPPTIVADQSFNDSRIQSRYSETGESPHGVNEFMMSSRAIPVLTRQLTS